MILNRLLNIESELEIRLSNTPIKDLNSRKKLKMAILYISKAIRVLKGCDNFPDDNVETIEL